MKFSKPVCTTLALTLAVEVVSSSLHEKSTEPHVEEADYSEPLAAGRGAIEFLVSARSELTRGAVFDMPGYRVWPMPPVTASSSILTLK
jgi:hypothetical protein